MIVTGKISEVREATADGRARGTTVGFVPTMGALHDGHLSLVRRARSETELCCVSIFVNPAQFGPYEDLDAYPRPVDDDLRACEREGVDLVFHPEPEEIYPEPPLTEVRVREIAEPMEGRFRPGHFDGVALVVAKLLAIVGPCRAYFGEKDAQQLRVVRRLVADLNLPAEVVGCPTVRDPDGLAVSSRNVHLSPDDRERALCLPRALFAMRDLVAAGERVAARLYAAGWTELERGRPDVVEYLEIADPETLERVDRLDGPAVALGALRISGTRLIDNVRLDPDGWAS